MSFCKCYLYEENGKTAVCVKTCIDGGNGWSPPPMCVCFLPPPVRSQGSALSAAVWPWFPWSICPLGPVVGSKDDRKLPLSPQKYSTVPSLSRDLLLFKTCILYFWMIKCRLAVNKVPADHEGTRWWQMPLQFRRLYVLSYYTVLHFERI